MRDLVSAFGAKATCRDVELRTTTSKMDPGRVKTRVRPDSCESISPRPAYNSLVLFQRLSKGRFKGIAFSAVRGSLHCYTAKTQS